MTTVSELCTAHNLNAKVVRAKLRRAVSSGDLKLERDSGEQWVVSAAILKLLNISDKPSKKQPAKAAAPTKPTTTKKPMSDEQRAAFKARMAKAREAKKQ